MSERDYNIRQLQAREWSEREKDEVTKSGETVEIESVCLACRTETDWVDCWNCGGKGGFDGDDLMEEDPLWYDEDSWRTCDVCRGRGGFRHCIVCAEEKYAR